MTTPQALLLGLLALVLLLLIWGRVRYDLVAFSALVVAVLIGVVPAAEAFSGFGHPATIIIALVLIVSKGLANAGALTVLANVLERPGRSTSAHIAVVSGFGASLSAIINNVAALALLMPIDIRAAERAKRSPALTLMPLAFATILGGMITLIGTPPNIVVSTYRMQEMGAPFGMFDFTPVGLVCALVGVSFVAFIGWRLLPADTRNQRAGEALFDAGAYLVELRVPEGSRAIGKTLRALDEIGDEKDVAIVAVLRGGMRLPIYGRFITVAPQDILLVETDARALDSFVTTLGLDYEQAEESRRETLGERASRREKEGSERGDLTFVEAVVRPDTRAIDTTAQALRLHDQHGVWLVGISREGRSIVSRVRHMPIRAGDILLLMGSSERLGRAVEWIGGLPLANRGLQVTDTSRAVLALGVFVAALVVSTLELVALPIALAAVAAIYVASSIVPVRSVYEAIDWPVVVLIGSLLPIGAALDRTGGSALIASSIVEFTEGLQPWVVLLLLMIVTMTLSDILNNTATAVIAAPIAVGVAKALDVNPDPFLMAVAVAASCAFLTPIGHQNNTLVMGPGGYRFTDYWRIGLPLEILIIIVGVPTILFVWPL